jgi:hypothetical protein
VTLDTELSAEAQLIDELLSSADVQALVGDRVMLNAADEGSALPYIVVTGTHDKELLLTGEVDMDHVTFTIVAWAQTAVEAEAVSDVVEDLLDGGDFTVLARVGGYDETTKFDASVLTADCWV